MTTISPLNNWKPKQSNPRKGSEYWREWNEQAKTADPDTYRANVNNKRKTWVTNDPDAVIGGLRRRSKKAVEEKKHCAICDHAFIEKSKLTNYLAGLQHAKEGCGGCRGEEELLCHLRLRFSRIANFTRYLATAQHAKKAALHQQSSS